MLTPLLLALIHSASAATLADLSEGDLVISEIMSTPAAVGYNRGQWFEIYNNSGVEVDLNGLEVADAGGVAFTVTETVVVAAGGYALFGTRYSSGDNGGLPDIDYRYTTALMTFNSYTDTLILQLGATTFDAVTYDTDAGFPGQAGSSFSVDPTTLDSSINDSAEAWCLSSSTYGDGDYGTPKAANDSCPVSVDSLLPGELLITEIMDTPSVVQDNKGEYFEVFNNSTLTADLDGLIVSSTSGELFVVSESITLRPSEYALFAARDVSLINGGLPTVDARYIYNVELRLSPNDDITISNSIDDFDSVDWDRTFPSTAGMAKNLATGSFDATDNDSSSSWCESLTTYGDGDYGTPKAANSDCDSDTDGDGYTEDVDCDDADADINPGADELCDGTDNDCDGAIDESDATDGSTFYADADNDRLGDPDVAVVRCARPAGYRTNGLDCDDTDASIGRAGSLFIDADGDGYGDPAATGTACAGDAGYTADSSDCDDTDSAIRPGAEEVCADGIDSDCDGNDSNDCAQDLATADSVLYGVSASEASGFRLATSDYNGDGTDDILVGARLNSDNGTYAGKAYLVLGPVSGDLDLDSADASYTGESVEDLAGVSLAGGEDLDGDGFEDLLIGASLDDDAATDAGAVYVIYGAASVGTADVDLATALKLTGAAASDKAGRSVAVIGDVNGDGSGELLVGVPEHDTSTLVNAGAAYLMYGPATASASLSTADVIFEGASAQDFTGFTVAPAGDTSGDGVPDLLIGAYRADPTSFNEGSTYLVSGASTGTVTLAASADIARFDGESSSDQAGEGAIWGAGDVNNDGYDDIIIGAQRNDPGSLTDAGAAYLVYGPFSGATSLSSAGAIFTGLSSSDNAGRSVSGGFDYNNDGYDDVIVGVKKDDTNGTSAGAAYLFFGPATGTTSMATADISFLGAAAGDEAGIAVTSGDVDGDGTPDILVGAHQESTGASAGGATYLMLND